ncbi:glycosyltransferase family 2 protein [Grimontia kaedaensis]|uniref:Glycosyltransferase family 2 protein n=1 Tax=Grimontia kaedaensis TaxID=2872157 RepID=A0ABY4WWK7_9GAMM|nr:glycosyltransferase family 2 protein [Grimontia kaedaensis]USH03291.1 glycosyltransferase family 2 protein [Grimontia kaedaensis]
MTIKLNVLILNWNSANDVAGLLISIAKSHFADFRVILIHNATSDEPAIRGLYNKYKNIFETHLVVNGSNLGYAGGNNAGYEYLKNNGLDGDVLILNPDVRVSPTTFEKMHQVLMEQGVGGVMCGALDQCGHSLYDYINLVGFTSKYRHTDRDSVVTDYLAGSCMMLKRQPLEQIGLFDENFFMYWEEVDLSLRMKRKGYKLLSTTKCKITRAANDNSRSLNAIKYSIRNSFLIRKKHPEFGLLAHYYYLLGMLILATAKTVKYKSLSYLSGYFESLIYK